MDEPVIKKLLLTRSMLKCAQLLLLISWLIYFMSGFISTVPRSLAASLHMMLAFLQIGVTICGKFARNFSPWMGVFLIVLNPLVLMILVVSLA